MTSVVNKKYSSYDIYCGRGSIFGNPFEIGKDGTREEVIERYRYWFNFLIRDKIFINELLKLKDKKLGCFCKQPDREILCHCDIIKEWLDKN